MAATLTKHNVLFREAVTAAKAGDKIVARALFREVSESEPKSEQAWLWRAALAETADEAIAHLERVLTLNPGNKTALDQLGGLRLAQRSKPKPAPEAEDGSGPCPFCSQQVHSGVSQCGRCGAYLKLSAFDNYLPNRGADEGALKNAIVRYEAAAKRQPTYESHFWVGMAHLNLGDLSEAALALERAFRLKPDEREVAFILKEIADQPIILAVDDSITVRRVVSSALKKAGYRVVVAEDGMQALAKLDEMTPAVILLDITMPRMDGYQVCKIVRQNALMQNIPVIMLSGKDGFFDKVKGKMAGCSDYLTKPFDADALTRTVQRHLAPAKRTAARKTTSWKQRFS
jgi:twitching motility two-component system response regulator PilG